MKVTKRVFEHTSTASPHIFSGGDDDKPKQSMSTPQYNDSESIVDKDRTQTQSTADKLNLCRGTTHPFKS
jgi:hypothetical protein